ncbi:MAG: type VI secretion system baseplate subunit TssE [Candidatus Binataceae bacterium]
MREQRLLERLADRERGGALTSASRAEVVVESILNHLQRVLNTRQGSAPIDPLYGVPDFTNLAGAFVSSSTREVEADILRVIEHYEPRLAEVSLKLVPDEKDPLALRFELLGSINVDDRKIAVHLATVVNPNGRVEIDR